MFLFMIPIYGAIILERLLDKEGLVISELRQPLLRLAGLLAAAFLGFLYKRYRITPYFDNSYEDKYSSFISSRDWFWKEKGFITNFVTLVTGDTYKMAEVFLTGILTLIRFVFALLLLITPVIALFFYKKYENRLTRILLLDYWVLFFLTYFIYGISELSNTSWRLCILLIMAFIVTVDFLFFILRQKYYNKFGVSVLLLYCYCAFNNSHIRISASFGSIIKRLCPDGGGSSGKRAYLWLLGALERSGCNERSDGFYDPYFHGFL